VTVPSCFNEMAIGLERGGADPAYEISDLWAALRALRFLPAR
jgi:hypothetical protein